MAKFCTYCGFPLEENVSVCSECGVSVPGMSAEIPAEQTIVNEVPVQAPVEEFTSKSVKEETKLYPPAGIASFFFLSFVYAIPLVGFLCSVILSFTSKNPSLKNYARSVLLWNLMAVIAVLLVVAGFFVLGLTLGVLFREFIDEFYYFRI
jgi:uncharacterized membrane protein YvbJ